MTMKPATAGGPYRVPRENGHWRAVALAAAVHLGLLFFLWVGVRWQNTEPVAVEAEVWDLSTQTAAPPPPPEPEPQAAPEPEPAPPPPPPRPVPVVETPPPEKAPDIALERKKKEKLAKEKADEEKKLAKLKQELEEKKEEERKLAEQKKLDEKKKLEKKKEDDRKLAEKQAADEKKEAEKLAKAKTEAANKKLEQARAAEMRRITGAVGTGTTGTAEKSTAPRRDNGYVAAITAKIKSNIAYGGAVDVPGNPRAEFRIEQLPTGEIISVRKIKSSGIPAYDNAVEAAINKSSPLPKKKDGTVERDVVAEFKLKE